MQFGAFRVWGFESLGLSIQGLGVAGLGFKTHDFLLKGFGVAVLLHSRLLNL